MDLKQEIAVNGDYKQVNRNSGKQFNDPGASKTNGDATGSIV